MSIDLSQLTRQELMALASEYGIKVNLKMKSMDLRQAIEMVVLPSQPDFVGKGPAPLLSDAKPEHTATQNVKPLPKPSLYPTEAPNVQQVEAAVQQHVLRGMEIVTLNEAEWHFRHGAMEDSGTMNQPLNSIVRCANNLMRAPNGFDNV